MSLQEILQNQHKLNVCFQLKEYHFCALNITHICIPLLLIIIHKRAILILAGPIPTKEMSPSTK